MTWTNHLILTGVKVKQFLFLYMNFPNSLQSITGSLRMLSAFYLLSALLNEEKGGEGGEGQKGGCVGAANAEITRCKILHFGNEASLVRGACSVKLNDVDDDSYDSSIAHSSESFQKRKICAQKALGLLLTAQRALKREKYRLTRFLTSCS